MVIVYGLLVVEVAFDYIYFFFMLSYFIFLPLYIFIFLTKYFFKLTRVDSLFSQCFLYEIDLYPG